MGFGAFVSSVISKLGLITVNLDTRWTGYTKDRKMILIRETFTDHSTIGKLSLDGVFQCHTLELSCRRQSGVKNCIPPGIYEVQITYSTRFKKDMPLLMNVPGYEGIRIHTGNSESNTDGCILVGKSTANDWVGESVVAFNELYPKIEKKLNDGKLYIEITGC